MLDRYTTNKEGHKTMFISKTGYWYAYVKTQGECYRGKGKTEKEAIQDSIKTNEKLL